MVAMTYWQLRTKDSKYPRKNTSNLDHVVLYCVKLQLRETMTNAREIGQIKKLLPKSSCHITAYLIESLFNFESTVI